MWKQGLFTIDGIELMNGAEFYPKAITRAHALGLFVAGNTDIHGTTSEEYIAQGNRRNMTLILAKDKSLPSLKDALLKRRTLAYSFGTLAGEEQLLKDFFNACVSTEVVHENGKGTKRVNITNNSSVPYVLRFGNENPVYLDPFKTIIRSVSKGKSLTFTVESMWCDEDSHPVIERKLR